MRETVKFVILTSHTLRQQRCRCGTPEILCSKNGGWTMSLDSLKYQEASAGGYRKVTILKNTICGW